MIPILPLPLPQPGTSKIIPTMNDDVIEWCAVIMSPEDADPMGHKEMRWADRITNRKWHGMQKEEKKKI